MADIVGVKWIYPPNWDGNAPDDPATGWDRVVVQLTNQSDGTGESDVTKVDISELRCSNGAVPTRTVIEKIQYQVDGTAPVYVVLEWDRAANENIAVLSGQGEFCYKKHGGNVDPGEAGDRTGDILLTTDGFSDGDSYDITLSIRLKES